MGNQLSSVYYLFNEIYGNYLHELSLTAKISLDLVTTVMLRHFINKRDINL